MAEKIATYRDLRVYQSAMTAAMEIFETTRKFPAEERYSLTDQIRRSSRSVCANLAEAWRKRRYEAAFIAKMSDAETEATETQVWLEFSLRCQYIPQDMHARLHDIYDHIVAQLVKMIDDRHKWLLYPK